MEKPRSPGHSGFFARTAITPRADQTIAPATTGNEGDRGVGKTLHRHSLK